MFCSKRLLMRLIRDRRGNITILAAASTPLMIITLALGLDVGNLSLQRRALQKDADLASIVAASKINDAENAVLDHFQSNGLNLAIRSGDDLLTPNGKVKYSDDVAFKTYKGYAEVVLGRYVADPTVSPDKRFVAGEAPFDAAEVTIREKSDLFFASAFTAAPNLTAVGTATSFKAAAFSVGSRLASLDGGLLNSLLGGLLGTQVTLSAMDYDSLLDADIDALNLTDQLGLDLGVTAGTYEDVLKTRITYKRFLGSLMKTTGLSPAVAGIVKQLQQSLNSTQVSLALEDVLDLGPYDQRPIHSGDNMQVNASVFDLIMAAATAANGGKQVAIDLGANVPGLATTQLKIAIGEPPVGTPMLAVGRPGSVVRTAQTRVSLTASIDGLSAIAGLKVRVPLYIEVADAEAKLSSISCLGGAKNNASVDVEAVPGVVEIALGNVDTTAFDNFGSTPRVTQATIVDSSLLKVKALGHVDADNMSTRTLTFSPSEIADGEIKNVSTSDTLTSLVSSLIGNLDLNINVLFITLGTPKAVQDALVSTLSVATVPLDKVLYNTLLVLGVKIGEADVRVTGVTCQRPVLVN